MNYNIVLYDILELWSYLMELLDDYYEIASQMFGEHFYHISWNIITKVIM